MKFFIQDFFSKCDHIRKNLQICSHLLKRSLMENFIFCAVQIEHGGTRAGWRSALITTPIFFIQVDCSTPIS